MNTYNIFKIYLLQNKVKLPYGCLPAPEHCWKDGYIDADVEVTEEQWNAMQWNPPLNYPVIMDENEADPKADPKPSYNDIVQEAREKAVNKAGLIQKLNGYATGVKIPEAYGVDSYEKEVMKRMNGRTTPEQDAKRDSIVQKVKELEKRIENGTLEERETIWQKIKDGTWTD